MTELFTNPQTPGVSTPLAQLMEDITTTPAPGTVESYAVSVAAPPGLRSASGQYRVMIGHEIMIVAASVDGGSPWAFTRGAEGTTPATHSVGDPIQHVLTAGALAQLAADVEAVAASAAASIAAADVAAESARAVAAEAAAAQKAANLGDLASAVAAQANLGLGSSATHPASDFAGNADAGGGALSATAGRTSTIAAPSLRDLISAKDAPFGAVADGSVIAFTQVVGNTAYYSNANSSQVGKLINIPGAGTEDGGTTAIAGTTVNGAGQTFPTGTLLVNTVAYFSTTGGFLSVPGVAGTVRYTGVATDGGGGGPRFTGCTGGVGTATDGQTVKLVTRDGFTSTITAAGAFTMAGTLSSGLNTVTGLTGSVPAAGTVIPVSGTGIPGTTTLTVGAGGTGTLSQNATVSGVQTITSYSATLAAAVTNDVLVAAPGWNNLYLGTDNSAAFQSFAAVCAGRLGLLPPGIYLYSQSLDLGAAAASRGVTWYGLTIFGAGAGNYATSGSAAGTFLYYTGPPNTAATGAGQSPISAFRPSDTLYAITFTGLSLRSLRALRCGTTPTAPTTTVSGAGQVISTTPSTLNVVSTAGLPTAGTISVAGVTGSVTYTGTTPTSFTNCTIPAGSYTATNAGSVAQIVDVSGNSSLTVNSTTGMPVSGVMELPYAGNPFGVGAFYSGISGNTLTGIRVVPGNSSYTPSVTDYVRTTHAGVFCEGLQQPNVSDLVIAGYRDQYGGMLSRNAGTGLWGNNFGAGFGTFARVVTVGWGRGVRMTNFFTGGTAVGDAGDIHLDTVTVIQSSDIGMELGTGGSMESCVGTNLKIANTGSSPTSIGYAVGIDGMVLNGPHVEGSAIAFRMASRGCVVNGGLCTHQTVGYQDAGSYAFYFTPTAKGNQFLGTQWYAANASTTRGFQYGCYFDPASSGNRVNTSLPVGWNIIDGVNTVGHVNGGGWGINGNKYVDATNPWDIGPIVITATNATWPIPPGAKTLRLKGLGGGGAGGSGPAAGGASPTNPNGAAGGNQGESVEAIVDVGTNTTLNVVVGGGGVGANPVTGSAAGGVNGLAGNQGGDSSVTGTGISVTALRGWGGGARALPTPAGASGYPYYYGSQGEPAAATVPVTGGAPGQGGASYATGGQRGGAPVGIGQGGGSAGGAALTNNASGGGGAASAGTPGVNGANPAAAGGTGADAAANSGGGGGGGGGGAAAAGGPYYPSGGGGHGGSGKWIIECIG